MRCRRAEPARRRQRRRGARREHADREARVRGACVRSQVSLFQYTWKTRSGKLFNNGYYRNMAMKRDWYYPTGNLPNGTAVGCASDLTIRGVGFDGSSSSRSSLLLMW